MAWFVKDTGGEDGVGPGDGPRDKHGVNKRRASDGSRCDDHESVFKRSGWDVRRWFDGYGGPGILRWFSHLRVWRCFIVRSLSMLQPRRQLQRGCREARPHAIATFRHFFNFSTKVIIFSYTQNAEIFNSMETYIIVK